MTFHCRNCLRDWPDAFCDECGALLMPNRPAAIHFLTDLKLTTAARSTPERAELLAAEGGQD